MCLCNGHGGIGFFLEACIDSSTLSLPSDRVIGDMNAEFVVPLLFKLYITNHYGQHSFRP